jgi:hypothetical protein
MSLFTKMLRIRLHNTAPLHISTIIDVRCEGGLVGTVILREE